MAMKSILIPLLLLLLTGCDVFNFDEEALIYPTQLEKLEMEELVELNEQYQSVNENICSTLNEYGFTGFSTVLFEGQSSPCLGREPVRIELTEPDTLLDLAVQTLLENGDYTGIDSSDVLRLDEMEPLKGCIICEGPDIDSRTLEWKFVFGKQRINGMEVYDSSITVIVDANGVNRIWGNWYREPYIPERANFLPDEIVQNLDGQTISWEEGETVYEHTIVADNLNLPDQITIIPFENSEENKLEMRAGWKIDIPDETVPFGGWTVIGDKIDGRILLVDKLIKSNDFGPVSENISK